MTEQQNKTFNITDIYLKKLSKIALLDKCEKLGIINCKSKNKNELIDIIINKKKQLNKEEINEEMKK